MGIRNLSAIIKRIAPHVLTRQIYLSNYKGKTIAIDASIYMYKYKSVYGGQWISTFHNFIKSLDGIKCVFVFDDKTCIQEKITERIRRTSRKQTLRERVESVKDALLTYKQTGTISAILYTFSPSNQHHNRLIGREYSTTANKSIPFEKIDEYIARSTNNLLPIYPSDIETIKSMCRAMGAETIEAKNMEAEKLCAMLCHEKKVDAVMTEDSDAYAYLSPKILCKIIAGQCIEVDMSQVLTSLSLEANEFVDMCILCGTDYSESIPGIGAVKAYKFIKTYRNIESIERVLKYDVSKTKYLRIREMFSVCPSGVGSFVFSETDEPELKRLLFHNNIKSEPRIYKSFLVK